MVWDAPNIDMSIANIIDGKPNVDTRPDLALLGDWLVDESLPGDAVEGCVFVNVAAHVAGPMRGWVLWLLEEGYRVFAKPKEGDCDVDDDMVDHLLRRFDEGDLERVYIGSNDARCFTEPLEELAEKGVGVTILGFPEFAGGMSDNPAFRFVDLEDIDGLIPTPLPRLTLTSLPMDGQWFEPSGTLGSH
jgi:uncharacterized protein